MENQAFVNKYKSIDFNLLFFREEESCSFEQQ